MSITADLQTQSQVSPLVQLFELEKSTGTFVYISPGEDTDGSALQLYDYSSTSTLRTYSPYPVVADGFDIKVTGAISRPTACLLYTSPSPRDGLLSRMPSSA